MVVLNIRPTIINKGSLYGAFGDKEALFKRVFEEYCANSDEGDAFYAVGDLDW
jgi:TetR/AcrR family transcriptional regulator, transcriptional repressor for nem operon